MAAASGLPLSEPQLCPATIGTASHAKIAPKNRLFPPMAMEGRFFRARTADVKQYRLTDDR
jgi:hypothetical protein